MNSKIDQAVGGIKKAVGDATGNEKMQAEGMAQKTKGQAGKQDMKDRLSGNTNERMGGSLNNNERMGGNLNNDNWGTH
ncbi:hypothetical protein MUCCIDRAFT_112233 [Mucor lusitanicus CBS 277.49]|uniref:Uncharacterized protein n=1 Tax=Mucor lusitanicus CBS 277.49 TaxID=747725 RepID=A0A162QN36_MUCCL|nr:hypothetical protein MUCCIDRAFT_112233 [Mucor lusitanicus CBS 277.49]